MTPSRRIFWVGTLVLALLGCGRGGEPANNKVGDKPSTEGPNVVVAFVAASTKDAVQEIADRFVEANKVDVKINADDSSKLALQITQEAPADLFLSANEKWAEYVQAKGFAKESKILLGNSLVLVVPTGNPAGVKRPEDLVRERVKRVAVAGPTVPAGIYARQALGNLGLWKTLEADKKVISGDNVRVTLTYVERGETEAGVVYSTDARISEHVEIAYSFEPSTHDPIRYPLVLLKQAQRHASARRFYEFLQGERAKRVFQKNGFAVFDGQ
jgi:molybdate transport system substrate-binding protein